MLSMQRIYTHTVTDGNLILKYADDTYLLIPASNIQTRAAELQNVEQWAEANNLKQNHKKTNEIIITNRRGKGTTIDTIDTARNWASYQSENPRSDNQAISQRALPASRQQMCAVAPCPENPEKPRQGRKRIAADIQDRRPCQGYICY